MKVSKKTLTQGHGGHRDTYLVRPIQTRVDSVTPVTSVFQALVVPCIRELPFGLRSGRWVLIGLIAACGAPREQVLVRQAVTRDVSPALHSISPRPTVDRDCTECPGFTLAPSATQQGGGSPAAAPNNPAGARVEQRAQGSRPALELVASFDGLGVGFDGPQGPSNVRNPSDNSLAVGLDHIIQTVNSRLAIFTKKGQRFDTTGRVLYGSVPTNTLFAGFTGTCEARNNGDAVVRYDQLADRWLVVMPIFRRAAARPDQPQLWKGSDSAYVAPTGVTGQPNGSRQLVVPPRDTTTPATGRGRGPAPATPPPADTGPYSMCYAVSTSPDPLGSWYRYEFLRPLFPDYPRPAVWPDGYYVPTSTGDDVIEKHACVVDRNRMLRGEPATEQCLVIDGVNFLNNADLDGTRLPPDGAPNPMLASGGTQLKGDLDDDGVYVWQFHVDWENPSRTRVTRSEKVAVAPYSYLCGGQLTNCVPTAGNRSAARCAGRQADGACRVPEPREPREHRCGALGQHRSGGWRRALVRVRCPA